MYTYYVLSSIENTITLPEIPAMAAAYTTAGLDIK
jgi:hypothetical protein